MAGAVVVEHSRDELGVGPGFGGLVEFGVCEVPGRGPELPEIAAEAGAVAGERLLALRCVEEPLIPVVALLRVGEDAGVADGDVFGGEAEDGLDVPGLEGRRGVGGAGAPIVPDDDGAFDAEGFEELEGVVGEGGDLAGAGGGIGHRGGGVSTLGWNQEADGWVGPGFPGFDERLVGDGGVGEAVEQEDGGAGGVAVFGVVDADVGEGEGGHVGAMLGVGGWVASGFLAPGLALAASWLLVLRL